MTQFKKLQLSNWRQFENIEIDLSNSVTVLTGTNGCGKTTLLNLLSQHFGWNVNLVATPYIGRKMKRRIWSDMRRRKEQEEDVSEQSNQRRIGTLDYASGTSTPISTPQIQQANYQIVFESQQPVSGLTIPSHRPAATYHAISDIPLAPKTSAQHYQEFQQLLLQSYNSTGSGIRHSPGGVMKKSIIALALMGFGNQMVQPNEEYKRLLDQFQSILHIVLPKDLEFSELTVQPPEVVLVTERGSFTLDAMSGGVNSIVSICWQVLMHSSESPDATIVIDEPENHLHPSMQRSLLPSLSEAFPQCRFVAATHSPFVLTSQLDASVYGLVPSPSGGIISHRLDPSNLASSPNRVLREILMVPSLLPVWAEQRLNEVIAKTVNDNPKEAANQIFKAMKELGIAENIDDIGTGTASNK